MADASTNESLRQSGEWLVVCACPDVCLTPVGPTMVPVPYQVCSMGVCSETLAPTVNFCGEKAFHLESHLTQTIGNEAGAGGGIVSGVNKAVCYPLSSSPTVNVCGKPLVRHDDVFLMNAAGPKQPPNTIGFAIWTGFTAAGEAITELYTTSKEKLDKVNEELHEKERKFRQGIKKLPKVFDPSNYEDVTAGEFFKDAYESGRDAIQEQIEAIPDFGERMYNDPIGTVMRMGADVASDPTVIPIVGPLLDPDTIDHLISGHPGKVVGSMLGKKAAGKLKEKGMEKTGLGGPKSRHDQAKAKLKDKKAQQNRLEKQLGRLKKKYGKGGGKISKAERKAGVTKEKVQNQREELRKQRAAAESETDKAKDSARKAADADTPLNNNVSDKVGPDKILPEKPLESAGVDINPCDTPEGAVIGSDGILNICIKPGP